MDHHPPYRAAVLAAAAVFILYLLTLAPTTAFWDTSEYIATAYILGLPHPPGNPLFVVLARVWILLLSPLGLSVAVRVNLFAAVTSAAAAGFLFLVAHRIVSSFVSERWMVLVGASTAALLSATAFTVWNHSNVNEKVYTVSVLIIAAVSWLTVRWYDRREQPESVRYLLAALYLMVLGSTNHLMSILPAPAVVLPLLLVGMGVLLRRDLWVRAVPLVVLGLSFNLFLPIRSAQDPVINEGEPTCESASGALVAIFSNGNAGCRALAANLQREQYGKPPVTERMAPFGYQLLQYFQYFDWQWSRGADPSPVPGNARIPFTLIFLALGGAGLYATFRADRSLFAYLAALAVILTIGLVYYLNFKYGYSLAPHVQEAGLHEVRERDYFFIGSFALWGMLAGIGLTWVWVTLASSLGTRSARLATAPVLLVAAIPLILNWPWASRAGDWAARDWAYDLLMSVEPYGVLFTNGDNDTFPLWYTQEVEGIRRDVTVIVGQYLHTLWYPRQLQRLTTPGRQRPFEPTPGFDLYADPGIPDSAILKVEPALVDRVVGGQLAEDLTVSFPTLAVIYPTGTYLDRSHRLALTIIRDSIGQRPIFFATTGGMMGDLGLSNWGVRHGFATKLVLEPVEELDARHTRGSSELGGERFNVPLTVELYEEVYAFRSLKNRDIWTDRSTLNIPLEFYALALQLADAVERSGGTPDQVERLRVDAAAFMVTSRGGALGT